MKNKTLFQIKAGSASACLLFALLSNNTAQAQSQYFTSAVANLGTYSWDGNNWNAPNSTANTGPYTSPWTAGQFARFYNGTGDNYTVTVNTAESMAGLYLNAGTTTTLNINDAGAGTGSLSVTPASSIQDGFGYTQGFLTGGGVVSINAPIGGTGGVEQESGGGHLQLYGNNSYSGGTLVTSSSTFLDYNNNNSFGTGNIGFYNTTFAIFENNGAATVNLANNIQILGGTTGINFIGASATESGNWALGGYTVNIRNNGVGTTETLSGVLSGTALPVTYSSANGGTILLTGVNTYTGSTVVGVTGDTAVTLQLGVANAIANSTAVTLAGGTLNTGGFAQAMAATLGLTASSSLSGLASGAEVDFADSHLTAWGSSTLNLPDWAQGTSLLRFGTSSAGLTSAQLSKIEFDGSAGTLGEAYLTPAGYLEEVPEPPAAILGVLGGIGMMWRARRRTA